LRLIQQRRGDLPERKLAAGPRTNAHDQKVMVAGCKLVENSFRYDTSIEAALKLMIRGKAASGIGDKVSMP
jgi:hypothetical protein